MQEWRTVNFFARHSDEQRAWANGRIVIKRLPASYTNSAVAPSDTVTLTLNASGQGSISLWCNDEGLIPSMYHMILPDKSCFCFVLPIAATNPVNIWTLLAAGITEQMPNYQTILDLIAAQGGGGATTAANVGISPQIGTYPVTLQPFLQQVVAENRFIENSFTQNELSIAGILPIIHNFGRSTNKVWIWDNTNTEIFPDDVVPSGSNATSVVLTTYQNIIGTWRYRIEV